MEIRLLLIQFQEEVDRISGTPAYLQRAEQFLEEKTKVLEKVLKGPEGIAQMYLYQYCCC